MMPRTSETKEDGFQNAKFSTVLLTSYMWPPWWEESELLWWIKWGMCGIDAVSCSYLVCGILHEAGDG